MGGFFSRDDWMIKSNFLPRRYLCGIGLMTGIFVLGGCADNERGAERRSPDEQGKMVSAPTLPEKLELGTEPSATRLTAIDIDVNPAGKGLPDGKGTYPEGAATYAQKCAACHGARGEGSGSIPKLVGVDHQKDFAFADDPKIPKTIGNYWPYATTLYDYIHRAMPYSAPGSLQPGETYSLVAFLLAENGIVPKTLVLNRETLPSIVMPARDKFKPDDREGGRTFR